MRVRPQQPSERFPFLGYIPLNQSKMVVGGILRVVSIEEYRDFVRAIWRFSIDRDRFAEAYDELIKEERERLDTSTPEEWGVDLTIQGQDSAAGAVVNGSLALADELGTPYTRGPSMSQSRNAHPDEVRGRMDFAPPLAENAQEVRVIALGETFQQGLD